MNKVISIIFILVLLLVSGVDVNAEQRRIAVIMSSDVESQKQVLDGFKKQIIAKAPSSLITTVFLSEMEPAAVVARVLAERPEVILTVGRNATMLAKESIKEKQIVFCMVFNSSEYSATNMTGVTIDIPSETKLKALQKLYPAAKKIGTLYSLNSVESYNELKAAAENQGYIIMAKKIANDSDFPGAVKEIGSQADCFFMLADANIYFGQTVKYLLLESLKNKFPVFGLSSFYTKAGAFASLDCDYTDIGYQSADIVEEILSGTKVSNIKIRLPRKFKYSINTVAADRMQITISPQIRKEASEIFN